MKLISIVTPCFNEKKNVEELSLKVKEVFSRIGKYKYEHIFIDNSSTDGTQKILRKLADQDKNIKVILNSRNFGHIRSPYYAILEAKGDAVLLMASDFQDPPGLIPNFIEKWEQGYKVVIGVKPSSNEHSLMFLIRTFYYKMINKLADINLIEHFTGFGLYDIKIIEILRDISDPYPYLRGLVAEIGFDIAKIEFIQPKRKYGITKNNFYTLYDLAMLGLTNYSKIPLRLATMLGFIMSLISLLIALIYFIYKIIFWKSFAVGIAPIVIGIFLFSSVQLFFLGIVGEYIGSIHTQILKRPLVIEKERINF